MSPAPTARSVNFLREKKNRQLKPNVPTSRLIRVRDTADTAAVLFVRLPIFVRYQWYEPKRRIELKSSARCNGIDSQTLARQVSLLASLICRCGSDLNKRVVVFNGRHQQTGGYRSTGLGLWVDNSGISRRMPADFRCKLLP